MADDIDMVAGEYVLGTLDDTEHKTFQRRLLTDPAAAAAVAAWQSRLSPLLLVIPEVAAPSALWDRVEGGVRPANDNSILRRWQFASIAAALVAIVSTGVALRPQPAPPASVQVAQAPAPSPLYQSIAALSETGSAPALLVTYDQKTKKMRVTPVDVSPRPGRSLELWAIAGKAAPKSIGLMHDKGATALDRLALDLEQDMTIAVSVEPKGGSPTGAPTGPVIYSGRMIQLTTS